MNRSFYLLLATFFMSLGSLGQTSFSLEEAKSYALTNNLRIQNTGLDLDNSVQKKKETIAIGLPQVNLSGSFNNFINLPVQVVDGAFIGQPGTLVSFKAGTTYNASGTLQATQMVFNGSYLVGIQVSKFFVTMQENISRQTNEDVVFNVINAYQICAVAKENVEFIDSMAILTQNLVDKQRTFLELGMMVKQDMDQLEYALLTTKNAQVNAKLQFDNALALLKFAMNYPLEQNIELTDNTVSLLTKKSISEGSSVTNNLNYQILNDAITLSQFNLKNERFTHLPSLNAFFQQTYNAYRNEFNFFADDKWYPQTLWGLQLNIPIFSSGLGNARLKQAQIRLLKDENSLKILEQSLKMQEIQTNNSLLSAQQKLELQMENVRLTKSIYYNTIAKEQIGKENSITVNQKYNQYLIAQSEYTAAMLDVFNAKLNLDKLYNQILDSNK